MADGDRMYYKEHVSVFSFGTYTSLMIQLGDGTLSGECDEIENSALKDVSADFAAGKIKWTFEGELACEEGSIYNWFTALGAEGALVFTDENGTVEGTFVVTKTSKKLGDALRWNVSLRGKKDVVAS